jgi:hypothetical protein
MMVALLLHGHASGLYWSRRIAKACRERNGFVMIVALDPPDFRTISNFRKRHLKARRAVPAGSEVVRDGRAGQTRPCRACWTKIKANASKHKAMSYERMKKPEAELKAEIARMLAAAEVADSKEDETFGQDKRGSRHREQSRPQAGSGLGGLRHCSESNLEAHEAHDVDGYVAPGRPKLPTTANGKIGGPLKRMRKKIVDGGFETPYRLRKQVVEPVAVSSMRLDDDPPA